MIAHSSSMQLSPWVVECPSNIAFLKYWGKRDAHLQWPANDSLSMTLNATKTITSCVRENRDYDRFTWNGVTLDSREHPEHKIIKHIDFLRKQLRCSSYLEIHSSNTFPADCGIASSASGYAALTIAVAAALSDARSFDELNAKGVTRDQLAHWSRRGSGSAGRSCYGGFVQWSAGKAPEDQSIAAVYPEEHWDLSDVIAVLSSEKKPIGSSEAHLAAWASPLYKIRLSGVQARLKRMKKALGAKDLEVLGGELEAEALEMHSIALTGSPSICYISEPTIRFTCWVRSMRATGKLPAWFTIDAGPNVHLICDSKDRDSVIKTIKNEWQDLDLIVDHVGVGPSLQRGNRS